MKDANCIFCKIANGDIPSNTIYEDDGFRVILDNAPATRGHALVLPKEHFENLFALPDDVAQAAVVVAKNVGKRLTERLGADGMNVVQNNGAAAGQTVMHFHIHLIPRCRDDHANILWEPTDPGAEALKALCEEING